MEAFWEPKGFQKSSEILDAILEAKKVDKTGGIRSAWRNARGVWREERRGDKDHLGQNFRKKNLAKNQGLGQEALESNLACRPRWGGGALRAFRRAEVIFDALGLRVVSVELLARWLLLRFPS